ncbi:hypothetical protein E5288_WYG022423 [Bos mutus]|uniref:Uncharacterized protein n=1 Tax=Bos mutus TaxID=72004 RepID=A0A6B0S0E2_9CETA|nr:hypothetical protein [Bos mutus]
MTEPTRLSSLEPAEVFGSDAVWQCDARKEATRWEDSSFCHDMDVLDSGVLEDGVTSNGVPRSTAPSGISNPEKKMSCGTQCPNPQSLSSGPLAQKQNGLRTAESCLKYSAKCLIVSKAWHGPGKKWMIYRFREQTCAERQQDVLCMALRKRLLQDKCKEAKGI